MPWFCLGPCGHFPLIFAHPGRSLSLPYGFKPLWVAPQPTPTLTPGRDGPGFQNAGGICEGRASLTSPGLGVGTGAAVRTELARRRIPALITLPRPQPAPSSRNSSRPSSLESSALTVRSRRAFRSAPRSHHPSLPQCGNARRTTRRHAADRAYRLGTVRTPPLIEIAFAQVLGDQFQAVAATLNLLGVLGVDRRPAFRTAKRLAAPAGVAMEAQHNHPGRRPSASDSATGAAER